MWPDLRLRAPDLHELMDDPYCDQEALDRTYRHFGPVNALVAGWRLVYLTLLRPHLSASRANTLLDIGCGGGDVARALAGWAARDGLTLRVTGIDADQRAIAYAQAQPQRSGVQFRQALSRDLVQEGGRYDLVVSNHLLHHLNDRECGAVLRDTERLCLRLAVHSDIRRDRLAYLLYVAFVAPFFRSSFIRTDGLLSIRRSFTAQELRAVVPRGWMVRALPPFRLLLLFRAATHA